MDSGPGDPRVLFPAVSAFIHELIKVDAKLSSLLTNLASIEADTYSVLSNQAGIVSPASLQVRWHQLVTQILETVITVNKMQPAALIPQHFSEIEIIIRQIHSQSPFNPAAKREHNQSFLQLKKEFTEIQNLAKDQMTLRLTRFKTDLTVKHESFFRTAQIDKDTKSQAIRDIRRNIDLILRLSSANKRKNEFVAPPECRMLSKFFNDLRLKPDSASRPRSRTPPGRSTSMNKFSIQTPSKQVKPQREQARSKTPPAKTSQIPRLVQKASDTSSTSVDSDKASVSSDRPLTKRLVPKRSTSSDSTSKLHAVKKPNDKASVSSEAPRASKGEVGQRRSLAGSARTKSTDNLMRATTPGPFRGPMTRAKASAVSTKKITEKTTIGNTAPKLKTSKPKPKPTAAVSPKEPTMESLSSGTDQLVLAVIKARQHASKSQTLERLQRDLSTENLCMEAGEKPTSLELFADFEKRLSKYEPLLNTGKRINTLMSPYKSSDIPSHVLSEIDMLMTELEPMSPSEGKIFGAAKSLAQLNSELEALLNGNSVDTKLAQDAFRSVERQLSDVQSRRMRSFVEEETKKLRDAKSTFSKFIEREKHAHVPKLEKLSRKELQGLYDSVSQELASLEAAVNQELAEITDSYSQEAQRLQQRFTDLSSTHQQIQQLHANMMGDGASNQMQLLLEHEETLC